MTKIPGAYSDGYERGRATDPERVETYIAHTMVGDPLADAMVAELSSFDQQESSELIQRGMQGGSANLPSSAPTSVREFFDSCTETPHWVDFESLLPGCRMFHRCTDLVLAGMVGGVLVEGFSTNIAKSFFLTGRLRDQGLRRLRQNNRHMLEIFLPGGLEHHCDGWVHSVRVRMVHARVRLLLRNSSEWDVDELGEPISAAHVGFALSAFSARLLQHLRRLGANFSAEERTSFMAVWRYAGYLMGIPETILYRDEDEALELFRIGRICEPKPSMESIVLASSLINTAPLLAGATKPLERRKLAGYVAQISRALIGDALADQLNYPMSSTFGILWKFRLLNKLERLRGSLGLGQQQSRSNLTTILDVSFYDKDGISFRLPDHIYSEQSTEW